MKILFIVNSFKRSGAERIVINLLNYFSEKYPNIQLFLYLLEAIDNPFPDPNNVIVLGRSKKKASHFLEFLQLPLHGYRIKDIIQKNSIDVSISFLSRANYANILSRHLGSKQRSIISERNTASLLYWSNSISHVLNRSLKRRLYPASDSIIAISKGVKQDLESTFHIAPDKVSVIYNPCDIQEIEQKSLSQIDHKWIGKEQYYSIITVGRLEKQKNQALLLQAFQKALATIPAARLILIGEGSQRSDLTRLANQLDVSSKVDLLGHVNNPFAYMKKANLFVLSSDVEGFGNVILEAMVCGCPVISTDCPSGPGEIITHGEDGLLVPVNDVESMARAMIELFRDRGLGQRLTTNGKRRVRDFNLPVIAEKYISVISSPE